MKIDAQDIESLIAKVVQWAAEGHREALYATSRDDGYICLRTEFVRHDGLFYNTIVITNVRIPELRRGKGLFTQLVNRLDGLCIFGIRWHQTVQDEWLRDSHIRQGDYEFDGSYYRVIGPPVPRDDQVRFEEHHHRFEKWLSGL